MSAPWVSKAQGLSLLLTSVLLTGCASQQIGDAPLPDNRQQIAVHADAIVWKPCPPGLPPGCEMNVFEGNPKAPDLFTVRFRLQPGFTMKPHTHPKHERVTVLSGQVSVAFGIEGTHDTATVFSAGDYYVNSKGVIHSVWIDKPTIMQITGVGPWQAHFVTEP